MSKLQQEAKLARIEIELSATQSAIGYQSPYSALMPGYKPLVDRVRSIEQKLDAIIKHLEVKVEYEQGYTVKRGE